MSDMLYNKAMDKVSFPLGGKLVSSQSLCYQIGDLLIFHEGFRLLKGKNQEHENTQIVLANYTC